MGKRCMKHWKKIILVVFIGTTIALVSAVAFRAPLAGLAIDSTIGPFDPSKSPPPPDYAQQASWVALPGIDDPSDRLPEGWEEEPNPARDKVDVFYIHPTGFAGNSNWNATVGDDTGMGIPVSVMLAGQASVFNGCGQLYAPEYREANLLSFMAPLLAPERTDAYQALDLAYEDVARAFDYFIEHYSKGRPFIIASHSQGTHHALRLLAEKIDRTPLYGRLIAAYAIGYGIPKDYFDRVFHDVVPCESPTQTGCLITWDTVRENIWFHTPRTHRYPDGWEYAGGKPLFCVNPLTWTTRSERVPPSAHKGALLARFVSEEVRPDRLEFVGLTHEFSWTEIREGQLWIAEQTGFFNDRLGIYHLFDVNLFWGNIRENARERTEAYLSGRGRYASNDRDSADENNEGF